MKHPDAEGIAMKKRYFGKGAERCAYELTEVDKYGQHLGQALVGKESIWDEPSQYQFHLDCAKTQINALRLANKFNANLSDMRLDLPPIEFLSCSFYTWRNESCAILSEKRIDPERYVKYNDNKGGVNTVNKAPPKLDGTLMEKDDEDDSDEALPTPPKNLQLIFVMTLVHNLSVF